MKKTTSFLIKLYRKMSPEKKIKLALQWSDLVRKVNKQGLKETGITSNGRN